MIRRLTLLFVLLVFSSAGQAQTAFTYKGTLVVNGSPVTGKYDFQLSLFSAPSGGTQVGAINKLNVSVSSGTYTVTLDFGSTSFSSPPLYLQVAYRKTGTSTWSPIPGRQQVSIRFAAVSQSTAQLQGKPVSATGPASGQVLKWNGTAWSPAADANSVYTAGAGLALASGAFSIAGGGVIASMLANGSVTPAKLSWPFAYSGSSASILFSLTNSGTGYAMRGTGGQAGVVGVSDGGFGLLGVSANNRGVHAESTNGTAVYGVSSGGPGVHGTSNSDFGVRGESSSSWGVYGTSTNNVGVWGYSAGSIGVHGRSVDGNGVSGYSVNGYGVVGSSDNSYAGYFYGILTASDKRFRIDHPLDPANKYLNHACIESSERLNVYSGNVTTDSEGIAAVFLPDWFEALNTDFRYQLTVVGQFAQAIIGSKIANGRFTIRTDRPNVEVSWQVTGVRQDAFARAHPLQVEEVKPDGERGLFMHPAEHGQPVSLGIRQTQERKVTRNKPIAPGRPSTRSR